MLTASYTLRDCSSGLLWQRLRQARRLAAQAGAMEAGRCDEPQALMLEHLGGTCPTHILRGCQALHGCVVLLILLRAPARGQAAAGFPAKASSLGVRSSSTCEAHTYQRRSSLCCAAKGGELGLMMRSSSLEQAIVAKVVGVPGVGSSRFGQRVKWGQCSSVATRSPSCTLACAAEGRLPAVHSP